MEILFKTFNLYSQDKGDLGFGNHIKTNSVVKVNKLVDQIQIKY